MSKRCQLLVFAGFFSVLGTARSAAAIDCSISRGGGSNLLNGLIGLSMTSCLAISTSELAAARKTDDDSRAAHRARAQLRKRLDFITANYADLRAATAVGKGEYLSAYATLLGCADAAQPVLAGVLRQKYTQLFAEPADYERTLAYTYIAIQQNSRLGAECDVPAPVAESRSHGTAMGPPGASASLDAAQTVRERMLVLGLQSKGGVPASETESLDPLLVAAVADTGNYDALGVDDVDAMLRVERMRDLLDCDAVTCAAELGGALGVSLVMHGSVGRLGDNLVLNLSVVSSGVAKVRARASSIAPDGLGLAAAIPDLVDGLVRRLGD